MHDLIIIGGGPAGLAAAAYALDKRLDVVLICPRLNGKAGLHWEDQPENALLGSAALAELQQRVLAHGQAVLQDSVVGVMPGAGGFAVVGERHTLYTRAALIATGAQPVMLGIPDEPLLVGHGLSYSVETYAALVAGRSVAVVGTTRRALRGVAELLQLGTRVILVAPAEGMLRTSALGRRLREHPEVELLEGYTVVGIEPGEQGQRLLTVARRNAQRRIPVAAVFAALGLIPGSQAARQVAAVDPEGFLVVDANHQTSLPGLFAAGDVTTQFGEHLLISIGDGVRAAMRAYDYLLAERMHLLGRDEPQHERLHTRS